MPGVPYTTATPVYQGVPGRCVSGDSRLQGYCRISNLRVISVPVGTDSVPGHQLFATLLRPTIRRDGNVAGHLVNWATLPYCRGQNQLSEMLREGRLCADYVGLSSRYQERLLEPEKFLRNMLPQ